MYESGETAAGLLYIVMEFVDGVDVARLLARQGALTVQEALAVTAEVCDALQYAHDCGIVHRDIKPSNIMVGAHGEVKVADFGLAKVTAASGETLGLTRSGTALGTLHFMASEALTLGAAVDHRADIYAVGVMFYQMLTGHLPQGMFQLPSKRVPGIDSRFDAVIVRALCDDREARYQQAAEITAELASIASTPASRAEQPHRRPPLAPPLLPRPTSAHQAPHAVKPNTSLWLTALILVAGGIGIWWLATYGFSEEQAAETAVPAVVLTPVVSPTPVIIAPSSPTVPNTIPPPPPKALPSAPTPSTPTTAPASPPDHTPALTSMAVTAPDLQQSHSWRDTTGRDLQAIFRGIEGSAVRLETGGKLYRVELSRLTTASQAQARQLQATLPAAVLPAVNSTSTLPPMYANRCAPSARAARLLKQGGSPAIDTAISKGLKWLDARQNKDGSWGTEQQAACTAMALQCHLARCDSFDATPQGLALSKGLLFLLELAAKNKHGLLSADWQGGGAMTGAYEHAIASAALGEAFIHTSGSSQQPPQLRDTFMRAVQLIIDQQNERGAWIAGGKVIVYDQSSIKEDLALSNWHFQALRVARDSGLPFADLNACIDRAISYILYKQTPDGGFGLNSRERPYNQWHLSGGAIAGLQLLAPQTNAGPIRQGLLFLRGSVTAEPHDWMANCDLYDWRLETDACFLAGGSEWTFYREQVFPAVLRAQAADGSFKAGKTDWAASGVTDPIHRQCLCLLILEVAHRLHTP